MPNIQSARKRVRQSLKRREQNRHRLGVLRGALKKFRKNQENTSPEDLQKSFQSVQSIIARSCQKGVIHRNKMTRLIRQCATVLKNPS